MQSTLDISNYHVFIPITQTSLGEKQTYKQIGQSMNILILISSFCTAIGYVTAVYDNHRWLRNITEFFIRNWRNPHLIFMSTCTSSILHIPSSTTWTKYSSECNLAFVCSYVLNWQNSLTNLGRNQSKVIARQMFMKCNKSIKDSNNKYNVLLNIHVSHVVHRMRSIFVNETLWNPTTHSRNY